MDVTIQREGYAVEAAVSRIDTGPGIAPGLEVEVLRYWLTDKWAFIQQHGYMSLDEAVRRDSDEIDADAIAAAEQEVLP